MVSSLYNGGFRTDIVMRTNEEGTNENETEKQKMRRRDMDTENESRVSAEYLNKLKRKKKLKRRL